MGLQLSNYQNYGSKSNLNYSEKETFIPTAAKDCPTQISNSSHMEANRFLEQGLQLYQHRQFSQAKVNFQKARIIYAKLGDKLGVAQTTFCMSLALYSLKKYHEAIQLANKSLQLTQEVSNLPTGESLRNYSLKGRIIDNLGNCHRHLQDYHQAIQYHQQSLKICRQIQDQAGQMAALNNLSLAHKAVGEYQQTFDYQQQSLAIAEQFGDLKTVSQVLKNLGNTCYLLEDYALAIKYYEQLLVSIKKLGIYRLEDLVWQNLINACRYLGQYQKVTKYTQQHLAIKQISGQNNHKKQMQYI